MILNYKPESLEKLSDDFYITTGISFLLFDENFKPLSYKRENRNKYCLCIRENENGILGCRHSDSALLERCKISRKPEKHICHAGLLDIAMPIIYEGNIIAYLILGQMKIEENIDKANPLIKGDKNARELYDSLPLFKEKEIESIVSLALIVAKYILFENVLMPRYEPSFDKALDYINENLSNRLTISEISKATYLPKSSLYNYFHTYYGCTVSEYINLKRIEKAKELLANSSLSVGEISEKLGFSSQQYFSKIFKKAEGVSPAQYKKG